MKIPLTKIVHGSLVTSWCCWEYPSHPDGCGNYLDKKWCPPQAPMFPNILDVSNYKSKDYGDMTITELREDKDPTMWLFYKEFNIGEWVNGFLEAHPSRSEKQARIPYLWQDKVYKQVYSEAMAFSWTLGKPSQLLERPEATGVNLFSTIRVNGGPVLKRNPKQKLYLMCILGLV